LLVERSLGWTVCAVPGRGITADEGPPVDVLGRDPGTAGGGEEINLAEEGLSCDGELRSTLVPFEVL
jgi:hypothetical protein